MPHVTKEFAIGSSASARNVTIRNSAIGWGFYIKLHRDVVKQVADPIHPIVLRSSPHCSHGLSIVTIPPPIQLNSVQRHSPHY